MSFVIANMTNGTNGTTGSSQVAEEEPGLVVVVLACALSSLWILFMGFYYSRFSGIFVTKVFSRLFIGKDAYLKIGSVSISVLSGKLMFRDVLYVTRDLTIRVVDGYAIFHWWQKFIPPNDEAVDKRQDPCCRLSVSLNGFEFHVYNRSELYDRLQDLYKKDRYGDAHNPDEDKIEGDKENTPVSDRHGKYQWRDLIPAIKFDINSGKFAFGNKMVERTLCLHFESGVAVYKVAKPASFLDLFTHKITCECKNVRVMLASSNGYTGDREDPPRYMGEEGFVVLKTQVCKLSYLLDEPGFVPGLNESVTETDPEWILDVTFMTSASISYGPWADRQRDQLQKFFFPLDYQEQPVSKALAPGQRRQHSGIDIRFDFKCDSTLETLFTKDQETQALHVCVGKDSYVRVYQPWRVNEYGYMSSVVAHLRQVEASTGLEYRQLIEADEVKITFHSTVPRVWNHTQHWSADICLHKATWYFLFAHKYFFQDLSTDWASKVAPELLTFIPYEWSLNITMKDFEMIWLANDYNWIDCSTSCQENLELALCGELLDLSFVLPYTTFLPELEETKFVLQAERVVGRLNVPESSTLRRSFLSLSRETYRRSSLHCRSTTSANVDPAEVMESADENPQFTDDDEFSGGWRRHTELSKDWVDVFSTPLLSLIIVYIYHPIVYGETFESVQERCGQDAPKSPTDLEPDIINLEVNANSCAFKFVGMLLKTLANIKENYFGGYQEFREFDARSLSKMKKTVASQSEESVDLNGGSKHENKLSLRPMEAHIHVNLSSIKAELTKQCSADEGLAPLLFTEHLTFEMHKSLSETRLQLQLTPTTIFAHDGVKRATPNKHLNHGYLHLSGLQLRGHAMFSGEDRPIECETLEYAWLLELQLGTIFGKITLPQLQAVFMWAEVFAFHFLDEENIMKDPVPHKMCQHGVLQTKCEKRPKSESEIESESAQCPTEDDFKYKFTRVSIEEVDLCLVEASCCCNVKISPIRLASCNLHSDSSKVGVSVLVHSIEVHQYMFLMSAKMLKNQLKITTAEACWLEAGSLHLGPVISDVCLKEDAGFKTRDQRDFLEKHDRKERRLWFLWTKDTTRDKRTAGKECRCGCVGGCVFFGKNVNGPMFFKVKKLDACRQEGEGKLFGSPDGWQNRDLDDCDDGFSDDKSVASKMMQRHNSWSGRTRSPVGATLSTSTYPRLRSETHSATSAVFRESGLQQTNARLFGSLSRETRERVQGSTSAWSVPDTFQKVSSIGGENRELQLPDRQRLTSDASFYSCSSGLEKKSSVSRTPSLKSLDSFASAVETNDQLSPSVCDDFQEQFILLPSLLLTKYRSHLQQLQCNHWLENEGFSYPNKRFDVMQNLKSINQLLKTCPKRLQFMTENPAIRQIALLSKKDTSGENDSMAEGRFKPEQMSVLRQVAMLRESDTSDGDKLSGKMDTLKRRRWKAQINNESPQSTTSRPDNTKLNKESSESGHNTAIVRIEGYVNVMASPLLLEAVQRYIKSTAEQANYLNPCTVLDKIHVKSLDVALTKYKSEQSEEKESRLNAFLTIPGVNVCFLQAFTNERNVSSYLQSPASSTSDLSDMTTTHDKCHPNPSLSLLAVRVDLISGQITRHFQPPSVKNDDSDGGVANTELDTDVKCKKYTGEKGNTEMAGSLDISQVQLQFSRLCDKSDFENSHTTAIPPKSSKVDFTYCKGNVVPFVGNLDVKRLKQEQIVIFVMLECGINSTSVKFGNFAIVKDGDNLAPQDISTPKRGGHSRSKSAPAQLLNKLVQGDMCDALRKSSHPTLYEHENEHVLESVIVEKQHDHISPRSTAGDSASSISSSSSRITHSDSTGRLTDNESEGDDEVDMRPLLGHVSPERIGKSFAPIKTSTEETPKPGYFLYRQSNAVVNFSCVWFNCASPSSVKPVPDTYHLHNNLLTTGIPAVSSWMPGIEKVKKTVLQLQHNQRHRYYLVTASIMAQGLPDKILCTHNITSKASRQSKYLQGEYSSQLIFYLRRQLTGSRKQKVFTALADEGSTPDLEDLAKGIMALSRQWKCVLGVTREEFVFRPAGSLKRPVVGRGVLTERDRAILMGMERQKSEQNLEDTSDVLHDNEDGALSAVVSPGTLHFSLSDRPSNKVTSTSISSVSSSSESDNLLSTRTRVKRRSGQSPRNNEAEQSLYSWFSSPVASPRSSGNGHTLLDKSDTNVPTVTWAKDVKEDDDLFGQMVSQPTSGKQIADEKVIFKAFFLGVGFLQPSEEFTGCSYETMSLLVKLRCIRLDIAEGKLDCLRKKKPKVEITTDDLQSNTPAFIFKSFETKINVKDTPHAKVRRDKDMAHTKDKNRSSSATRLRSATVKMACHTATQSINLSLIRLLLQVADMFDILGENYEGVKSVNNSRHAIFQGVDSGSATSVKADNQKCWRIMHQVSNLYSALPSENTLKQKVPLRDCKINIEAAPNKPERPQLLRALSSPKDIKFVARGSPGPPKLKVLFLIALRKLKCITTLGELCLQTELNDINFCVSRKVEEHQGTLIKKASLEACKRKVVVSSVSGHLQKARLVLSEAGHGNGTVVSCVLNSTSHGMYSCVEKKDDVKQRLLFSLGIIDVDIPQHPVALHCMMTRSSKTLSKQISEIQSQRTVMRTFSSLERSSLVDVSREKGPEQVPDSSTTGQVLRSDVDTTDGGVVTPVSSYTFASRVNNDLPNMSVTVVLNGFSVGASLLPSLKVEYKIGSVLSSGRTGKENVFKLDMPQHHLSFTSKVKSLDSSIPASTSIQLPRVDISGTLDFLRRESLEKNADIPLKSMKHLQMVADIGTFNQNLSTDLLNHLIFIQKGFMKEVNDVLQRVSGESQPIPLWRSASTDDLDDAEKTGLLMFSFTLNLKGIQITATTPSATAVRLETGVVNFKISNSDPSRKSRIDSENKAQKLNVKSKVFMKADVDLTLSLGQFFKDQVLDETTDFHQLAFFKTQVGMNNSSQDQEKTEEKETLLVTVVRPSVYVEPVAFDKAVLLYLNYKNAYSYWNEQRMTLTEDVQSATQAVFEKLPQPHPTAQLAGFLFLQLTVSELGICLPLSVNQEQPLVTASGQGEVSSALVLTMGKMLLTCCSSASFVSKGNFTQFCVRFTEKFDVKKIDWRPDSTEGVLINSCMVPDGTYEICSRTIRHPYANDSTKAGKMVMSLMWKMCGIDLHCDTDIGKRLKALGQTLTAVAGDSDIANLDSVAEEPNGAKDFDKVSDSEDEDEDDDCFDETDFNTDGGWNREPQNLEKQMWQQARKVNELRRRQDVEVNVLKTETDTLHELESAVFNEFRRDMRRKIERQSHRPLFSVNDSKRPSISGGTTSGAAKISKSTVSARRLSRSVKKDAVDEVDFGESSEMVKLTNPAASNVIVSPRSWKAPTSEISFQYPKMDTKMGTLSPNVNQPSPNSSRKYSGQPDKRSRTPVQNQSMLASSEHSSFTSQRSTAPADQDLDFDLDVMVNIESGKCVLHSTNETKVDSSEPRTFAQRLHEPLKVSLSSGPRHRSKGGMKQQEEPVDSSIILLPGVEVRVHYSSVTNSETSINMTQDDTFTSSVSDAMLALKKSGKHASLYISLLVQPLPKEMLLRPVMLDFVDQALNPIVAPIDFEATDQFSVDNKSIHSEYEADPAASSFISSATSETTSFPVDIVIVARVQPSNIRISCLPTSRVECLMRIPSLDLAFSSKPSPNKICNRSFVRNQSVTLDARSTSVRSSGSDTGIVRCYDSGGISFTICLSRFSLFIYHPYGKQHSVAKKTTSSPDDAGQSLPKARVNVTEPQTVSGKKDALSLSLEFIKFNLSRRRFNDVSASTRLDKQGSQDEIAVESSTLVKVSGLCDIGSATFTYDMRRLQEILDFPRCWHKRGLFSRLFLGKEGTYATKSANVPAPDVTDGVEKSPSTPITPERPIASSSNIIGHRRNISTPLPGLLPFLSSPGLFGGTAPTTPTNTKTEAHGRSRDTRSHRERDVDEVDSPASCSSTISSATSPTAKWETAVVLGINLSRLDVSTNMANVMGKTVWSTSDLRASGNLRLTNAGERTLRSKLSIRQSTWESRGGIAGGHIELQDISSYVNVNERLGSEPEHSGNIRFRYCETRLDYMGTCILMGNIFAFRIAMMDEWTTSNVKSRSADDLLKVDEGHSGATNATVYLRGNLHWKNIRLVICRSTTSDLIKMMKKIETFFTQQANSSVILLSSMSRPLDYGDAVSSLSNPLSQPAQEKNEKEIKKDGLKYQHWSKPLSTISNLKCGILSSPLPEKGAVVGGSLELSGWEVSLACFNGLNFRSQTWALFSITQPSATFSSKVGCVEKSCQVRRARSIQKLSFQLGSQTPSPKTSDPQEATHMAMICKVQRGRRNPPSMGSSVSEWLSYVSSVNNVPSPTGDVSPPPKLKSEVDPAFTRRRNKSMSGGTHRYDHVSEAIFGFPSFQVDFTSEHDQPIRVQFSSTDQFSESWPVATNSPHIVECSLESHFYDSLYVTMDVGLIFFLHEIIQAYVKENETAAASSSATPGPHVKSETDAASPAPADNENKTATVGQTKRVRQFRSKCWKLEPTVRFLSWAGRRVEGVNIDWVLEKLGFSHARLTIPKWVQRGAMDPMDRFLSVLMYRLLLAVEENKSK